MSASVRCLRNGAARAASSENWRSASSFLGALDAVDDRDFQEIVEPPELRRLTLTFFLPPVEDTDDACEPRFDVAFESWLGRYLRFALFAFAS